MSWMASLALYELGTAQPQLVLIVCCGLYSIDSIYSKSRKPIRLFITIYIGGEILNVNVRTTLSEI